MKRVITFGTFDLLHEGHLRILKRAAEEGDYLIVGVSTDRLNLEKGKGSYFKESQRLGYIKALEYVDEAFLEDSLEKKQEYIAEYKADVLVMGDDWTGKFDWVDCTVKYLPRTEGISSTDLKKSLFQRFKCIKVVFADTYIKKHYDCAMAIVDELVDQNVAPIILQSENIGDCSDVAALIFFNYPRTLVDKSLNHIPRILIDHGASNLKWFLSNRERYDYFDWIITGGPDHSSSLLSFFPNVNTASKVRSVGYIKSGDLLKKHNLLKSDYLQYNLDPEKPVILLAPTWYKSKQVDILKAVQIVSTFENHAVLLHPETEMIDASTCNVIPPGIGVATTLINMADVIISDTSSIVFEGAALDKAVIQLRLREYPDNGSVMYDFPYTAGDLELFIGGLPSLVDDLSETVQKLLSRDEQILGILKEFQSRLLNGTWIKSTTSREMASEIQRCILVGAQRNIVSDASERHVKGIEDHHKRILLAESRLIAHGAGNYDGHRVSNSRDAFDAVINRCRVIELDVVMGADGLLVAHDSLESSYGFDVPFSEVRTKDFSKAKFCEKMSTLDLDYVFKRAKSLNRFIIIDVKETRGKYIEIAREIVNIAEESGAVEHLIVQAYCKEDFELLVDIGVKNSILAVWKYYFRDPLGEDANKFVTECLAIDAAVVKGISVPYSNRFMDSFSIDDPRIFKIMSYWRRIYVHGAPLKEYSRILNKGFGLFADAFSEKFEFKSVPEDFSWRQYGFLNKDLLDVGLNNEIDLTLHYLKYDEGRPTVFNIPEDTDVWEAFRSRREIREYGAAGVDSIKAFLTKFG